MVKRPPLEVELSEKLYAHLESGKPARTFAYTDEEREIVDGWFLLTTKPVIYAANIAEADLGKDISEIPRFGQGSGHCQGGARGNAGYFRRY